MSQTKGSIQPALSVDARHGPPSGCCKRSRPLQRYIVCRASAGPRSDGRTPHTAGARAAETTARRGGRRAWRGCGELLLGAREELGRDDRRGREQDPLGGWPQAVPRLPAGAGVGDDLALVEKALADVEAVGEHVAY